MINPGFMNLKDIQDEAGFGHFDLGLTEAQHEVLAKMRVNDTNIYDNYGEIDTVERDIVGFFEGLGNHHEAAKEQASIVAGLIHQTIAGFKSETAWITIRASEPTDFFNIPRWHIDGRFYESDGEEQMKAVIALKGDGTLLNRLPVEKRADFMEALSADVDEAECRQRCMQIVEPAHTETTPPGCGTVFIVGSERAAVHSEPPIAEERIFLSIVPGNKEQITALRERHGYVRQAGSPTLPICTP